MVTPAFRFTLVLLSVWLLANAQEPTGAIAGTVTDPSGATVPRAVVTAIDQRTSRTYTVHTAENGSFTFSALPPGEYGVKIEAQDFAPYELSRVNIEIDRTVRIAAELVISGRQTVDVSGAAEMVETASTSLGQTVSQQQIVDLPLNGRNFTQLGLLQAGVVPLTNGLAAAGGSIKASHAFAVNGQRPESNNYLLDGARNVNRMDGGFGIRTPIDAIQEFRILTHTAPPEYGSNSGATVSVITRSGSNTPHGSAYYFGRNDAVDARNFFSADVEPLKQHQYGATFGGPLRRNTLFFFGFWEGFRNRQGITKTATVPTPEERSGDFSGLQDPSTGNRLINFATGQPFPKTTSRLPSSIPHRSGCSTSSRSAMFPRRCIEPLRFFVTIRIRAASSWIMWHPSMINSHCVTRPYPVPTSTRFRFAALMCQVSPPVMICAHTRLQSPIPTCSVRLRLTRFALRFCAILSFSTNASTARVHAHWDSTTNRHSIQRKGRRISS